jgi:hypothetical protein
VTDDCDNHLSTPSKMSLESENTPGGENISSSSSESTDPTDETWDDWVEDPTPCISLFDDAKMPSVSDALMHDLEKHCFDLNGFSKRLSVYHCLQPFQHSDADGCLCKILISINELASSIISAQMLVRLLLAG